MKKTATNKLKPAMRRGSKASPTIHAEKPISFLRKPLKADFGGLFKALGKGITDSAIGKWESIGNDVLEGALALGLSTKPEELAFLLVQRALSRALIDLVSESISLFPADIDDNAADRLAAQVTQDLNAIEFTLDGTFLKHPAKIELLDRVRPLLIVWLQSQGIASLPAEAIGRRLTTYFVYGLQQELARHRKAYASLLEVLQTPVEAASLREMAWEGYFALLQRQAEESVFAEPFSLRQVYVPMIAAWHDDSKRDCLQEEDPISAVRKARSPRKIVALHDELRIWLKRTDPRDAIRVISGGPGSGKSSFAKIFSADLAVEHRRVLLIPLHLIDPEGDVEDEIGRFARQEGALGIHPLDPDFPETELLIIFDGLDELAGQGKVGENIARDFVNGVERMVLRQNANTYRLRILLSGRELVVQENESFFKRPGQILDILPYFTPPQDRNEFQDPKKLLSTDLRDIWWKNYGSLTGRRYEALPDELKLRDLDEVTAQPLLNYLVALSYTRAKLDFKAGLNVNTVYADLIEAVHERGYEKGRAHASIRHMELKDFTRVLEEIGLAAWHGDGRTTTVREIREHCEASQIVDLLDKFKEGAERNVIRLLAAFFFRRYGQRPSGDQTFVFTHKSFGEYLTARRIVRAMNRVVKELTSVDKEPDERWDERTALEHWGKVCGPSAFTNYLRDFIQREVAALPMDIAKRWQSVFTKLLNFVINFGFPMERLRPTTFRSGIQRMRNSEEAVLVVLNACALITREVSAIDHKTPKSFGTWVRTLQGQRAGATSCVGLSSLSFLDLSSCRLDCRDLLEANLSYSHFRDTAAWFAVFWHADLRGADMRKCILRGANLHRARLNGANLEGADLHMANLAGADLSGANLKDADLSGANLRNIKWDGANFENVKLKVPINVPAKLRELLGITSVPVESLSDDVEIAHSEQEEW